MVSDARYARLNQWRWHLEHGYAVRSDHFYRDGKRRCRKKGMQREILGLARDDPRQGEHVNGDKLDNRDGNLRIAERGQLDNQQNVGLRADNASGYRGVSWHKGRKKWQARAKIGSRERHLGYFDTAEEADVAAKAFRAENMPFSEDARLAKV